MREDPAETMLEDENDQELEDLQVNNLVLTVAMKRIARIAREGSFPTGPRGKELALEKIRGLAEAMVLLGDSDA